MIAKDQPLAEISVYYKKTRDHLERHDLSDQQKVYPSVRKRLQEAKSLYLAWVDVYEEYRRGFENEDLSLALFPVKRFLSSLGKGLEGSFFEVIRPRIPVEVYFLVQDTYQKFQCEKKFVLAEGGEFESHSVYDEIAEELRKLPAPSPHGTQAKTHLDTIRVNDIVKIYYESVTYDSPLTWPLLLHEAVHDIFETNKLTNLFKLPVQKEPWKAEVAIDLCAAMYFGPVYAVSLAKYHERFPGGGGISHPAQGPRLYGLLQLLGDLASEKGDLPPTVGKVIERSFDIVRDLWGHYMLQKLEVQDEIKRLYDEVKQPTVDFIHSKGLRPFIEAVKQEPDLQEESFEKTLSYIESGIICATDPRVLFNSLVTLKNELQFEYVAESVKKWYVSKMWLMARNQGQSTLF